MSSTAVATPIPDEIQLPTKAFEAVHIEHEMGRKEDAPNPSSIICEAADETCEGLHLLLTNQFTAAMDKMRPKAHDSIYHALGQSTIMFMQAVLTLDLGDIRLAQEAIRQGVEVCQRFRRRTSAVYRLLIRPDYNTYTIEELHAELCYAECLLENAILTFVEDQSLVTFIKGGLKIRSCYQSYKECMQMLATRNWEESREKKHFESGVHMGVGAFNLMISQLPTRILKLLEFIGFSGNKQVGLSELEVGCRQWDTLRGPLCSIVLITYHTFILFILGLGNGDLDLSQELVSGLLQKYPNGVLSMFFQARQYQVRGEIDSAIKQYSDAIIAQNEWVPFHYICYWEQLWCYTYKGAWNDAIRTADILLEGCRWSKACYQYIRACCLYSKMLEEGRPDLLEEVVANMRNVPGFKQRIAGKSIPIEKFVCKKSEKFLAQGNRLLLPTVELMYMWNSFPMMGKNRQLLLTTLGKVEAELPRVKRLKETEAGHVDDYCLVVLLRGVCLRYTGQYPEAEECFKEVLENQNQVKDDTYLPPFAAAELGFLHLLQNQFEKSREYLDISRNNYHDYLLESLVHFRIHSAIKSMKSSGFISTPTTPSPDASPFSLPMLAPTHPNGQVIDKFPYLSRSSDVVSVSEKCPLAAASAVNNNSNVQTAVSE